MGFRFFRRIRIIPGVTLNLSKRGISTSLGVRGAKVTFGTHGTRATVGIPGTGLFYTEKLSKKKRVTSGDEVPVIPPMQPEEYRMEHTDQRDNNPVSNTHTLRNTLMIVGGCFVLLIFLARPSSTSSTNTSNSAPSVFQKESVKNEDASPSQPITKKASETTPENEGTHQPAVSETQTTAATTPQPQVVRTERPNYIDPSIVYVSSGEQDKTFHRSNCISLDPSHTETSIKAATSQGYVPCKICKPTTLKGNEQYTGSISSSYVPIENNNNPTVFPIVTSNGFSSGPSSYSQHSSGSGDVHVRGYTRKDGTYVSPHTRSRPNR